MEIGRQLLQTVSDESEPLTVKTSRVVNAAHGPVVHALAAHSLRLGEAVLDLEEKGMRFEAVPLIRSLFECAITVSWLADSREGVDAWRSDGLRKRKLLAKEMADSANKIFREGAANLPHLDEPEVETIAADQGRRFRDRCLALRGGAEAYVYYRFMSAYSHPSIDLADQYLQLDPEVPAGVVLRTRPEPIAPSYLFIAVASMIWATRALDVMRQIPRHRDYLRGVARELGVPDVLRLTPEARIAEDRAEQHRRRANWKGPRRRERPSEAEPPGQ